MDRFAFLLRVPADRREAFDAAAKSVCSEISAALARLSVSNFSAWAIDAFCFCYGEAQNGLDGVAAEAARIAAKLPCEVVALPGEMRLMYRDIGDVRTDKQLIRHRVFGTHIKPGCAEEYKARHDRLIAQRGGDSFGKETNFTIWCAKDTFNFGYCEIVKALDGEPTPAERQASADWETKMLEIMDWYTDDVDWLTGLRHEPARLVWAQPER